MTEGAAANDRRMLYGLGGKGQSALAVLYGLSNPCCAARQGRYDLGFDHHAVIRGV